MSAITLILLLAAVVAATAATAVAHHTRGLRREISGLREELLAARVSVPAARHTPALEEVRAVVADALAEEKERELAEARAFWAAQEAREEADGGTYAFSGLDHDAAGPDAEHSALGEYPSLVDAALLDSLLGGPEGPEGPDDPGDGSAADLGADSGADGDVQPFLPRQVSAEEADTPGPASASPGGDSAELRAARRRHPSDPHHSLSGEPVVPAQAVAPGSAVGDHAHTIERLGRLAEEGTALCDVRSGPLGTLDVYVFADDTTVCLTPGHRETAERLSHALDDGQMPVLLGGSGVSGAYALTFACGRETVYVLADRVIASR